MSQDFDWNVVRSNCMKCCLGCKDRRIEPVNCHMDCEKYLQEKEEQMRVSRLLRINSATSHRRLIRRFYG